VSPEVRRERLAAAGFVDYPRLDQVPTSIASFKEQWTDRLMKGEVADTDEYTGMPEQRKAGIVLIQHSQWHHICNTSSRLETVLR